jgi:hypothetical protein
MSEETEIEQTDHDIGAHGRAADHDSGPGESLREGLRAARREQTGREPEDSRRDEERRSAEPRGRAARATEADAA